MTREEHARLLADILKNAKDPASVSDALTKLQEDYQATLANAELTSADNASLKQRNDELIQQNMKLFLKVGKVPEEKQQQSDQPKKFEDLFDEKGRLK